MAPGPERLVLIVDDDEGMREIFSFLVKEEGHRVEIAVNGEEGLAKALALTPDLIILDLMMPRQGGFEVLRGLQGTDLSRVPVLVASGSSLDQSTSELIRQESNVVEFLEKPVDQPRFVAILRRILSSPGLNLPV